MKKINELSKYEKIGVWSLLIIICVMLIAFFISYSNPDNHLTQVSCNGENYTFIGFDVEEQIKEKCNLYNKYGITIQEDSIDFNKSMYLR